MRIRPLLPFVLLIGLGVLATPTGARADAGPNDLNALAIEWARGHYASPLFCEIDAKPVRGLRRVLIVPGPPNRSSPSAWIRFVDMKIERATRCFDATGAAIPNVIGKIEVQLPGRSHPETARRDLKLALRRERGFAFNVLAGALRVQEVGAGEAGAQVVDFRGGSAKLHRIAPASDEARELAEFHSPRTVLLELRAHDGTTLRFPLFMLEVR